MFDGYLRKGVDGNVKPVGIWLARVGLTADVLTGVGMVMSVACAVSIGSGHLIWGFVLLIAAALPDLFDGPVAKASGMQSIRGAFFDSVADRITDSLVLGGVAWYLMARHHGMMAMLPFALLGATQLISYERAKAESLGFEAKGGLMERAERIIVLCIALILRQFLVPILAVMLILTIVTGVTRFLKVWHQATDQNPVLAARRRPPSPFVQNLVQAWQETSDLDRRRRRWREWAEEQRQTRRRARSGRYP